MASLLIVQVRETTMGLAEDAAGFAAEQAMAKTQVFPGWARELAQFLTGVGFAPIPIHGMTERAEHGLDFSPYTLPPAFTTGWLIAMDVSRYGHSADGFVVDQIGGVWHEWRYREVKPVLTWKPILFVRNPVSRSDAALVEEVYRPCAVAAVAAMTHYPHMQKNGILHIPPNLVPPEEY